jgi:hypothetical protein
MYTHPRKTPLTPHYEWIERINENNNVEDFNRMVKIARHWYMKATMFEDILNDIDMEVLVKTFKHRFPEVSVYFEHKEIK